jgi:hypothetical protein
LLAGIEQKVMRVMEKCGLGIVKEKLKLIMLKVQRVTIFRKEVVKVRMISGGTIETKYTKTKSRFVFSVFTQYCIEINFDIICISRYFSCGMENY